MVRSGVIREWMVWEWMWEMGEGIGGAGISVRVWTGGSVRVQAGESVRAQVGPHSGS
jgi:hypothetical protein